MIRRKAQSAIKSDTSSSSKSSSAYGAGEYRKFSPRNSRNNSKESNEQTGTRSSPRTSRDESSYKSSMMEEVDNDISSSSANYGTEMEIPNVYSFNSAEDTGSLDNSNGKSNSNSNSNNDLVWRVRQLETSNMLLMERYYELATKHDLLCNLLHNNLVTNMGSSSSDGIGTDILGARVDLDNHMESRRRAYSNLSTDTGNDDSTINTNTGGNTNNQTDSETASLATEKGGVDVLVKERMEAAQLLFDAVVDNNTFEAAGLVRGIATLKDSNVATQQGVCSLVDAINLASVQDGGGGHITRKYSLPASFDSYQKRQKVETYNNNNHQKSNPDLRNLRQLDNKNNVNVSSSNANINVFEKVKETQEKNQGKPLSHMKSI